MANTNSSQEKVLSGVVGFFDEPHALIEATKKVRAANYAHYDAFTPYPVHGMDDAMGLKRSPLPYVTFVAGLMGCSLGYLFQYWTSAVDWPLNVGGKPFHSGPAFIPVTFECTVLFAALFTVGAMFLINGLPNVKRKAIDPSITNNRFALFIEAPIPKEIADEDEEEEEAAQRQQQAKNFKQFNESEASQFLKGLGAKDVRSVYAEGWF